MSERIFGHVAGFPPGATFENRADLAAAGVHRPRRAGISGSATEGADSVVLSGGYADDDDRGDVIVYTGDGARDAQTGSQTRNQPLARGSRALLTSLDTGLPVRVVRGGSSARGPADGSYRYDGLFRVADAWQHRGVDGFYVWRFRLERASG